MNLFDYISNYAAVHGIKNYSVKNSVLTLNDFAQQQTFAPGIAFFYKVCISGEIQDVADLSKPCMTVTTPTDFWDFGQIGIVRDDGVIQRLESDFIFVADGIMNINLPTGANALFSQVHNAQMFYCYLSILPDSSEDSHKESAPSTVYDIRVNQRVI